MSFTNDGAPIAGCQSLPVQLGHATCTTVFPALGTRVIGASYTGTDQWAAAVAQPEKLRVVDWPLDAWIYIARDPEKPVYGQGLIITALALGAKDGPDLGGTFTFYDNDKLLITRPVTPDRSLWDAEQVPGARAALGLPLGVGAHRIKAVYSGDGIYRGAWPASMDFTVGKGEPIVAISSTPAQIGQPILVSASVTARNPTGTLTFEGIPQCVRLPIEATGFAHCRTAYPQLGEFSVTATYSGDANLQPASATLRISVAKAIAGLYVAASEGSAVAGQPVRVSALLMGAPGLPRPSGSVSFTSDVSPAAGSAVIDGEGRATWAGMFGAGTQRVTAEFKGDGNYASVIAPATFLIARANTTTTLSAPAAGPFTATVTVAAPGTGTPTGSVRFFRDGAALGVAPLVKGVAILIASVAGTITAEYPGDNNYNASTSSASAAAPQALVMLSSERNPVAAGQPVTLAAVVMPNPGSLVPGGSLRFTANGAALGTVTLSAGRATFTANLAPGSHAIEAAYSGDAVYPAVLGSLTQIVTGEHSGLGLSAGVPAPVAGQPLTFTALLASGGSGTVRFSDGAALLGSVTLSGGVATLSLSGLAAGVHTISAAWSGDAMHAAETAELSYAVARAATVTFLTLGTGAASAKVSALAPGAGAPSGTVRFVNPRTDALLGSAQLVNGAAVAVLPRGAALVAAVYSGDSNFTESVSETASALAVVNAASYAAAAVAPDEIVTLFGPIPAGLSAVAVTDRSGAARAARLLHSVAGQAAIVLPDLPPGPATVIAGEWQALVTVATAVPGLFTADASGKGAPAGLTEPIEIGEEGAVVVLYGTGFRHAATPVCLIAGEVVEVLYAGAQSDFPGLDQLNVRLPASLRGAGAVVLELKTDGVAANPVMLTIR